MGTVHNIGRGALVAATCAANIMPHPAIAASDINRMSAHELLYFTDTPVAHVAAFRDFQREVRLERRREEAFNELQRIARHRAYEARG